MRKAHHFGLAVLLAWVAVGCGPRYRSAFSYHFQDNQEADVAAIMERLPNASQDDAPENALGRPLAAATTHTEDGEGRRLVVWDLSSGEELWTAAFDAVTQPEILGDIVVSSSREEIHGYDLRDGRALWSYRLPDLAYVGAARDGDTVYWSATVGALGGARRVGHVVAIDARTGAERWRHEVQGVFGQPAASGGLVFVPWERQNIAVLDGLNGIELARLRSTDDVIAWAFNHPTGLYYGGRSIYRLTHRSSSGERASSTHVRPALTSLPRQPESIWPDGFVPKPGTRSARGRIRVYFNPAPAPDAETIRIEGDSYYFVFYRYVFAYDLEGQLRWSRILEQDVINAEAMPHGLLTVGEQGQLRLLDRDTGNDRWTRDLEVQLASIALDAAGFDPAAESGESRSLRQSLNEIALDPDNRLVPARAYAVQMLAGLPPAEITRDLLDLYQQRSMPGALKQAIREALRARRGGAEFLMAALDRRFDYLEETQAPPLEAIVPALLEMRHSESLPRLISHLMDHETPSAVLPQLVEAIVELGEAGAIPALRRFLVLYHADGEFDGPVADQEPEEEGDEPVRANPQASALALAAAGIFRHGGEEGRSLLSSLSSERANTRPPVSEHIGGLFENEADEARRAALEEQEAAQRALRLAAARAEAALPRQLSQRDINQTFAENADSIRDCIAGELSRNPLLTQVRTVFILNRDGTASDVTVSPNGQEITDCMSERVRLIQFPRFRQMMMRATFTVRIRGGEQPTETASALEQLPADAPWWAWAQTRAEQGGPAPVPTTIAWWTSREPPAAPEPPPAVAVPAEEAELPPGMTVAVTPDQPAAPDPSTSTSETPPSNDAPEQPPAPPTAPADETPWWAAAGGDDDEEEPSEDSTE